MNKTRTAYTKIYLDALVNNLPSLSINLITISKEELEEKKAELIDLVKKSSFYKKGDNIKIYAVDNKVNRQFDFIDEVE